MMYTVSLADHDLVYDEIAYIAAHAVVYNPITYSQESGWGFGTQFASKNWAMYKEELVAKGRERITSNDVRSAIILFKDALQKDQYFVEARLELGKAYAIIGKAAAAEKEFQKVLRQMPASREAHIECARLALLRRDHAAALAEVQPYLSNDPLDIEAVELAGMAFALRGSYDAALTNLGRVIEAEPSRESAFIAIAKVKAAMGNVQGAKEQLSLLLQKDQRNRAARYALAELQTAEGDTTGRGWSLELKDILGGMGVNALESLRGNRLHLRGVGLCEMELEILGVRMAGS